MSSNNARWAHSDNEKVKLAVQRGMRGREISAMFPDRTPISILNKVAEARKKLAEEESGVEAVLHQRKPWTPEENQSLDAAMFQGKSFLEIRSVFPQRSVDSIRSHIRDRTMGNVRSQQAGPQGPPYNPWEASNADFEGFDRVDTGYGGIAPNINEHPDLANGLDFTPTPHRPGDPPGFVTSEQMLWGKKSGED